MTPEGIRDSLREKAKSRKIDPDLMYFRYVACQTIYRLHEEWGDRFMLKGGMCHWLAEGDSARYTEDVDAHFPDARTEIASLLPEVLQKAFYDSNSPSGLLEDGVTYGEFRAAEELSHCGGLRFRFKAWIGGTRVDMQLDCGFGPVAGEDFVVRPLPVLAKGVPQGFARVQPDDGILSEKLHAVVDKGDGNTRLKDFYDLWKMRETGRVDADKLVRSVAVTFLNRGTDIETNPEAFGAVWCMVHENDWQRFLRRSRLPHSLTLQDTVATYRDFYRGILSQAKELGYQPPTAAISPRPAV